MLRFWLCWTWCISPGGYSKSQEVLQELSCRFGLLAVFSLHTRLLKQGFQFQPLRHIKRWHIYIEAGDADLVLWERLYLNGLAVNHGAQISRNDHDIERAIDGVLRPTAWSGLEVVPDVLALLAGPDEFEDATANGVFGDIAGVADLRERTDIASTGTSDDLAPV